MIFRIRDPIDARLVKTYFDTKYDMKQTINIRSESAFYNQNDLKLSELSAIEEDDYWGGFEKFQHRCVFFISKK